MTCSTLPNRLVRIAIVLETKMFETYRGIVYPQQEDHMGHMNVAWYTSKFDEATWHMLAHIGITPAYIRESNKGMAALEITYKYLAEVSAGDLLVVRSEIKEMRDKTILFKHTCCNHAGRRCPYGSRSPKVLPFPRACKRTL